MTWSQPCGCLNVKTPISYLIVRNHLCPHFMTVFRLYQLNRKKKIFLPNYQFYLEPVIERNLWARTIQTWNHFYYISNSQTMLIPPKSVSLTVLLFVYSDISHKVVRRLWASFTLIIKSPNVDPGYTQPCDQYLVFWPKFIAPGITQWDVVI